MEIDERSKKYLQSQIIYRLDGCDDKDANWILDLCKQTYISGANEQKDIDIKMAHDAIFRILMSTTHFLGEQCDEIADLLVEAMNNDGYNIQK